MVFLVRIDRWDPRTDGPLTDLALRGRLEAQGYRVTRRLLAAGTVDATPHEEREKIAAVLSGLLRVTIDGESAILAAGDSVHVPRGATRRAEVLGSTPVVILDAVRHQPIAHLPQAPGDAWSCSTSRRASGA